MTPVFCCGFECGALGSNGEHWTSNAAYSISTSTVRSGSRSLRSNNASAYITSTLPSGGAGIIVSRFYLYFATLPTSDSFLYTVESTNNVSLQFQQSGSTLRAYAAGTASTGIAITTGRWYRIDIKFNTSSNPVLCDLSVNGVATPQASGALAGFTPTTVKIGGGTNGDIFFDDLIVSFTTGDYPIGNGYVNHFVPTSDGTHTATTTTIVKGTIASPTGGGNVAGSTDVFNWVNGVPLLGGATDNTRLVNQQTAGTTLYAEVVFGPAPGILTPKYGPRAVEVITADREATTATGDFTTKINDNGTESNVIARGVVAGVITDRFATKQFATPPTGGSWGVASGAGNFNNLRARFGYASDATPDQYWRGIMVEAEFAEWPQKITQVKQAVNRSNNY